MLAEKRQPSSDGTESLADARPASPTGRGLRSIAARLFLATLLPSSLVVIALAAVASVTAKDALTASLMRHVRDVAGVAATQFDPEILSFLSPGSEDARTYVSQAKKLEDAARALDSARAFVIDDEGRVVVDGLRALPIGAEAPRAALDQSELARARAGERVLSIPFSSDDGRRFLRAYAPIVTKDGAPSRYVLALEARADLLDDVDTIARTLALAAILFVILTLIGSVVVARTITAPLLALADGAAKMGAGALDVPLPPPRGDDEVALLARTLEEMRQALLARDAERQMMLAGIAHEVRNPLGGMELFSGLLEEGIRDLPSDAAVPSSTKGELLDQTARVRRELRYLTGVVNDFLAFARDVPLHREPVVVKDLLDDVCSLTRKVGSADVVVECPADLTSSFDRGRVKQALLNLVENALQATPVDKQVTVRARKEGDLLTLAVVDEGKGIDAATLARVFQPFFTTKEKGSGLGLPLVKKLAKDHGGDCVLTSEVGKGTTAALTLVDKGPSGDVERGWSEETARATTARAADEEGMLGDG